MSVSWASPQPHQHYSRQLGQSPASPASARLTFAVEREAASIMIIDNASTQPHQHHQHQPARPLRQNERRASILSISWASPQPHQYHGHQLGRSPASPASARPTFAVEGEAGQHHEHQLGQSPASPASVSLTLRQNERRRGLAWPLSANQAQVHLKFSPVGPCSLQVVKGL